MLPVDRFAKKAKTLGASQAKVIDPKNTEGVVYLLPAGKSPHGVDISPDGKYIIASSKLASITTVFNVEKMLTAIKNKDFSGNEDGIPVLNYDAVSRMLK